jgi:hypothetical protein
MNTIDDLERALRNLEQLAPDAGDMHQRVVHQLAIRPRPARTARLAISAAAAAAIVIVIAALAIAIASTGRHAHPVAPGNNGSHNSSAAPSVHPSPTPTPTPTSTPSTAAAVRSFDLTWRFRVRAVPGYTITRESITATDQQARVTEQANANKDIGGIDVYSPGVVPSNLAILTAGSPVSVHGNAGYFAVTGKSSALIWRYAPNAWAEVSGDWGYDASTASGTQSVDPVLARTGELAIAQAVTTAGSGPLRVDFTLGYLPSGLRLQHTTFYADFDRGQPLCELDFVDNTPGQATPDGPDFAVTIARTALATDTGQPGNTAFVPNTTVAGRPANYSSGFLAVRYPHDSELDISVDANHTARYTKADLIAIAEQAAPAGTPTDPTTWAAGDDAVPR